MNRVAKEGTVVAIDGPAGAGKSTLAIRLATALGLAYLNTGTMYRTLARESLGRGIDPSDGPALADLARSLRFSIDREGSPPALLVEGVEAGEDIVTEDVEAVVSTVSAHPAVREVFREEQRRLGSPGGVIEGRDIGRVVFPDADLKVFLHADPIERVRRREAERGSGGLAEAIGRRDALDDRVNPLIPAPDAVVVDTTGRSADAVFEQVLTLARRALAAATDQ